MVDIEAAELLNSGVVARHGLHVFGHLVNIGHIATENLMGESRDVGLIDETALAQPEVDEIGSGCWGEHRAEVDGHVEEAECRVASGGILRIVVEITNHHLEVSLEETGTQGDEYEGKHHEGEGEATALEGADRNGETGIAEEHHGNTSDYTFAIANLVGKDTADDRHEIDGCQEDRVELSGGSGREAKLSLQVEQEDGQHGVVAKAFAGVGERQSIQTFGLSFEHKFFYLLIDYFAAAKIQLFGRTIEPSKLSCAGVQIFFYLFRNNAAHRASSENHKLQNAIHYIRCAEVKIFSEGCQCQRLTGYDSRHRRGTERTVYGASDERGEIDLKMDRIQTTIQQISGINSGIAESIALSVGIANDQLNVLEDIRNNTRELASIRNHLSRIESQMAIVTGE